ncbi:MAG: 3-phosphoserine/phosphohydroxythreonine transaminase [Fibrobacteria bacterium]|nr:3-phosphoserine/phosphohydroxythreonine transaminase [Fibrobacteria bacterium]
MKEVFNFSAGPAVLPKEVFESSAAAVKNFKDTGLSILEMSHRSQEIMPVMDEAMALVTELLNLPENYKVLFLQGGASTQFLMVPYNLLDSQAKAAYIETGTWSKKAIKEAKLFGNVEVLASSAESTFSYIPKVTDIPGDASYLHITSNNTIYGTQYHNFPETSVPMVADMSSDIFSRTFDVSKFGLIYAGAQKNMGPAGITLAIVREDMLGKVKREIPTMLNYQTHIDKVSMFNTPPVFSLFVAKETLKWLKNKGGVAAIQKINEAKANRLYEEIDSNPLYKGAAVKEDRSFMNVPFVMTKEGLDAEFLQFALERGLSGLKGHRSIGGFRASIYNAMPEEGVTALIDCMREFAKLKG